MRYSKFFVAMAILLVAASAHADRIFTGETAAGAFYKIDAPDSWKPGDTLILFQHGLTFDAPTPNPDLGPLAELQLSEGYAIAASSYRQRSWALFTAPDDNADLLAVFKQSVGAPGAIIPYGGSLGGLIALKLAEDSRFAPVPGVYSACPPAAGSRAWDAAIDLRLAYDVICKSAGSLPKGAQPIPWAYNLDDIPTDLSDLEDEAQVLETLVPLNQCTGVNLPDYLRNDAMVRRLGQLMNLGHITSEKFFVTNAAYATYALSDLVRAPDKLDGLNPFTNIGVDYNDATLNADIARIEAEPFGALYFHWSSDFRGNIGTAKVISVQTSMDQLVIPANQYVLRQTLPSTQLTSGIVAETSPTHCGFTLAEGVSGWEALRVWMATNKQPSVADLQTGCGEAVSQGAAGPCRYDPNAIVPTFDSQVRPREAITAAPVDARYSGMWYDPQRSGEGIDLEVLGDGRAFVGWFTFPPKGSSVAQAWFSGVGQILQNGIEFPDVLQPFPDGKGGLNNTHWGRLALVFDDCNHGSMRWDGPSGWGSMEVPITRLSSLSNLGCDAPPPSTPDQQLSGAWYDPKYYGSGFMFEDLGAARGHDINTVYFGFDAKGNQVWFGGILELDPAMPQGQTAASYSGRLYQPVGTNFGADFHANDIVKLPQNALSDLQTSCNSGTATLSLFQTTTNATQTDLALKRSVIPAGVATSCAQ